jgi:hypothetical protein
MSMMGKEEMIKSVAQALPSYNWRFYAAPNLLRGGLEQH